MSTERGWRSWRGARARRALVAWLNIAASAVLLFVVPAAAQSSQDIQTQLDLDRRAASQSANPQSMPSELSERQAVARARAQVAGNVLRITLVGDGANRRYQIRMEKEGKVFTLFVHARTGKVTRGG